MAAVENVDAEFLGNCISPMRAFAGDERVHTFVSSQFQVRTGAAGHDANFSQMPLPPGMMRGFAPVAWASRMASSAREMFICVLKPMVWP